MLLHDLQIVIQRIMSWKNLHLYQLVKTRDSIKGQVCLNCLPAIWRTKHLALIALTFVLFSCQTRMAVIKYGDKYGIIDSKGKMVVEPQWDYILGENEGLYPVKKDSVWGYINRQGEVVIELKYWDANFFYEGFACVGNENGKYGFINRKGDTIIPFKYDGSFGGFSKGLADVTVNDSCGYIDKKGELVIPAEYKICYPFLSDLAVVWTFENRLVLIDKKGQTFEYREEDYRHKRLWSLNV